jgi:hypothetical protein
MRATKRRPTSKVPIMKGQKPYSEPVPTKVKSASLESSSKSYPLSATVIFTVSLQMSSGSSEIEGVKHLIVV